MLPSLLGGDKPSLPLASLKPRSGPFLFLIKSMEALGSGTFGGGGVSLKAALDLHLGLQVPQGLSELVEPCLSLVPFPQVFILEMLVEKIFDLAFMPAMNGKSGAL